MKCISAGKDRNKLIDCKTAFNAGLEAAAIIAQADYEMPVNGNVGVAIYCARNQIAHEIRKLIK